LAGELAAQLCKIPFLKILMLQAGIRRKNNTADINNITSVVRLMSVKEGAFCNIRCDPNYFKMM